MRGRRPDPARVAAKDADAGPRGAVHTSAMRRTGSCRCRCGQQRVIEAGGDIEVHADRTGGPRQALAATAPRGVAPSQRAGRWPTPGRRSRSGRALRRRVRASRSERMREAEGRRSRATGPASRPSEIVAASGPAASSSRRGGRLCMTRLEEVRVLHRKVRARAQSIRDTADGEEVGTRIDARPPARAPFSGPCRTASAGVPRGHRPWRPSHPKSARHRGRASAGRPGCCGLGRGDDAGRMSMLERGQSGREGQVRGEGRGPSTRRTRQAPASEAHDDARSSPRRRRRDGNDVRRSRRAMVRGSRRNTSRAAVCPKLDVQPLEGTHAQRSSEAR